MLSDYRTVDYPTSHLTGYQALLIGRTKSAKVVRELPLAQDCIPESHLYLQQRQATAAEKPQF